MDDTTKADRGRSFENAIEPALSIAFVLRGSTSSIYGVSKRISETLKDYPDVSVIHTKSSVGKLWIREGGGMQ